MKDIIKLIKYTDISYMKRQIGCMIFLLLNTVLTLVYPSCISVIVDQGVAKGSIEDIIKYSILMFVLGILIMITNYVQQIKYAKLGREICEILRNRMFEKLCKTNYKFWCENRVGDIITICHRFVANKEYAMGNVLKDTKIEKMPFLEEITLEKHKECKNCWARNLCVGACPNENLVNAGTTQKSDSKNCRFIQAMYNDLIHAYLELTVENKKQLLG